MERCRELWGVGESQSRRTDLFTGMHRWACFCNTKALLLVSPSPSTWSALHPNAPRAQKPARRWLGSIERLESRERWRERARELLSEGQREDGFNHFACILKGQKKKKKLLSSFSYFLVNRDKHSSYLS